VSERVAETLEFLELDHLADEYARGLSGGQQKLLEMGRVLMTDPDLLLLDEPIAGVNPVLQEQLLEYIHELNDDGRSVLLIEHDMEVVMEHCDQIIVMVEGKKLSQGPPEMIQDDDRVIKAYLGGETI
jgi:branched-chain amino acid transport system ATP-binding protein